MTGGLLLLSLAGLLLPACTPATDTGKGDPTPPECADGEVASGDTCVPEACGTSAWPEEDGIVAWVDAGAADGGDGSEAAPFRTIQEGADLAGAAGGGAVAIAAGTYTENVKLDDTHDGVRLVGRCKELVTVDGGPASDTVVSTIRFTDEAGAADATVTHLSITGGSYGVATAGGAVTVEDVDIATSMFAGLAASGSDASASLTVRDVTLTNILATPDGDDFVGWVSLFWGASLDAERLHLLGPGALESGAVGVMVLDGSTAEVRDSEISGIAGYGAYVVGYEAGEGPTRLTMRDSTISSITAADGAGSGLVAGAGKSATELDLDNVSFTDIESGVITLSDLSSLVAAGITIDNVYGDEGVGAVGMLGGTASFSDLSISNAQGVALLQAGGTLDLATTTIAGTTFEGGGDGGDAIEVVGGSLTSTDLLIDSFDRMGILVDGAETTTTLTDTTITGGTGAATGTSTAIQVTGGGWVSTDGLTIDDVLGYGIAVGGEDEAGDATIGTAVMIDCYISGLVDPDVEADGGARGIAVAEAGSLVDTTDVTIDGTEGVGVIMSRGATGSFSRLTVSGTNGGERGVGGTGVQLASEAAATFAELTLDENTGAAFVLADGSATVDGAEITSTLANPEGRGGHAIELQDPTSDLTLSDARLTDNLDFAFVMIAGTATLDGIEVTGTTSPLTSGGGGVAIVGDSIATLTDVDIHDNTGVGLGVQERAHVSCSGCTWENNGFANVLLTGGALVVADAVVGASAPDSENGGGFGVFVDSTTDLGSGSLVLADSSIDAQPLAAVYVEGAGAYTIDGCDLVGGAGDGTTNYPNGDAVFATDGIQPWDGTTGLWITNSTLRDSATYALLLDGVGATLEGNTWSGNTVDIFQDRCAGAPAVTGADEAETTDVCPRDGYDLLVLDFNYDNLPSSSSYVK